MKPEEEQGNQGRRMQGWDEQLAKAEEDGNQGTCQGGGLAAAVAEGGGTAQAMAEGW